MILHDVTSTSHSAANSGIQRVVREMQASLSAKTEVTPICFDPYAGYWRTLDAAESVLASTGQNTSYQQGVFNRWTRTQKARGVARRFFFGRGLESKATSNSAFLTAEIFRPRVYRHYSELFPRVSGPKVAIFHDAIALRLPEFTSRNTRLRIPQYMRELLDFDGVAAVSDASREDLLAFWTQQSVPESKRPVVRTISNATNFAADQVNSEGLASNEVLVVCTIEGRKNHMSLLSASKLLWDEGLDFRLRLIGGIRPETGSQARQMIIDFKEKGYPVTWDGSVSDNVLHRAYQDCRFTVYPSLYEGFGLPVLESLSYGRPCVCTPYGALKETAGQGGCLMIPDGAPKSIAIGMRTLIQDDTKLRTLAEEAGKIRFRNWGEHAEEIIQFIEELK